MKKLMIPCLAILVAGCSPHKQEHGENPRAALNDVEKSLTEYRRETQERVNALCEADQFVSSDKPEDGANYLINRLGLVSCLAGIEKIEVDLEVGRLEAQICSSDSTQMDWTYSNQGETQFYFVESEEKVQAFRAVLDSKSTKLEDYTEFSKLKAFEKEIPFVARHTYSAEKEDDEALKAKADELFKGQKTWGDMSYLFTANCSASDETSSTPELYGTYALKVLFGENFGGDKTHDLFMSQSVNDFLSDDLSKVNIFSDMVEDGIRTSAKLTAKKLNPISLTFALTVDEGQINLTIDQLDLYHNWYNGISSGPQSINAEEIEAGSIGGSSEIPAPDLAPWQQALQEGKEFRRDHYRRAIEDMQNQQ